ncbi:MAG: ATP-binding protein [Ruminococcaceae bacterium]|nr:ATP-binding protein [Oscillospiraceae bacterium]
MLAKINSMGLLGIEGFPVEVQADASQGLPSFEVVGLPDNAVKESRERVRAAIKNCGLEFPTRRITVNLAPADRKKEGALYDLPILLGILGASGQLKALPQDAIFLGEVALDGSVRKITGVLPMALEARRRGVREIYLPRENATEATLADGITVYGISHVKELLSHFSGETPLSPTEKWIPSETTCNVPDFGDVCGQENVKRAIEIAAVGGHNILLVGPPGGGKSMLAQRIPGILPPLSKEEALETTAIHSVRGLVSEENPLLSERPFRSPHHQMSAMGMTGGGRVPQPGEISLAHNGVLFLDEFPEFAPTALEALRQPLEDGKITITRVAGTLTYPASFMLVCAMNPCKCGWYGYSKERCECTPRMVAQYRKRISGPLLDRIDMHVQVPMVPYEEMIRPGSAESSATIRERIIKVRERIAPRFAGTKVTCNARMTPEQLKEHCKLEGGANNLMKQAYDKLGLTARSYTKLLRVARTIADMAGSETIETVHLAEAIQFRPNEN